MKVNPLLVGLGIGLFAAASGSRRANASSGGGALDDDFDLPPTPPESPYGSTYANLPEPTNERQAELRFYLEEAGLHPEWVLFFEAVAANESNFKNLVGLGNAALYPSWAQPNIKASQSAQNREHQAAVNAYIRNEDYFYNCGYPQEAYTFGSGGWFALLPANAVRAFGGTELACLDPYFVFSKGGSVVMVIEMVRRLMNWTKWKLDPTFGNLRVGLGNPSEMGDELALQETVFKPKGLAARYTQIGADPNLAWVTPPPLPPKDPVGLFNYLTSL